MAINHAVTVPSANDKPNPTGYNPSNPPTQQNPLSCSYPCTIAGCGLNIDLLYVDPSTVNDDNYDSSLPGPGFNLTTSEANDPNFGGLAFTYNPPLT